jgi:hypothetical protein
MARSECSPSDGIRYLESLILRLLSFSGTDHDQNENGIDSVRG